MDRKYFKHETELQTCFGPHVKIIIVYWFLFYPGPYFQFSALDSIHFYKNGWDGNRDIMFNVFMAAKCLHIIGLNACKQGSTHRWMRTKKVLKSVHSILS